MDPRLRGTLTQLTASSTCRCKTEMYIDAVDNNWDNWGVHGSNTEMYIDAVDNGVDQIEIYIDAVGKCIHVDLRLLIKKLLNGSLPPVGNY